MSDSTHNSGREPVCVLGFSRSGTSLTTRVLSLLGLYLGPEEDMLPSSETDNREGYWEPRWINELNDEILGVLGQPWWQPLVAEPEWPERPEMAPLRERARMLVAEKFAGERRWGFKDPRTPLTLPFWRQVVPDMSYVICLRNPVDAVASLQRRPEPTLSVRTWGELWLEYTARALKETTGQRRMLVFYEDFFRDPRTEIERLAGFLGLDEASLQKRVDDAVPVVTRDLRHHSTSVVELAADPGMPAEARTLFLALRAAEEARRSKPGDETRMLARAVERVAPELWWVNRLAARSAYDAEQARREAAAALDEAAALRARLDESEREHGRRLQELEHGLTAAAEEARREASTRAALESSASWRLTAPLRMAKRHVRGRGG